MSAFVGTFSQSSSSTFFVGGARATGSAVIGAGFGEAAGFGFAKRSTSTSSLLLLSRPTGALSEPFGADAAVGRFTAAATGADDALLEAAAASNAANRSFIVAISSFRKVAESSQRGNAPIIRFLTHSSRNESSAPTRGELEYVFECVTANGRDVFPVCPPFSCFSVVAPAALSPAQRLVVETNLTSSHMAPATDSFPSSAN